MKLIKKQIAGITNFYIDNINLSLDTTKRYSINLWSEGTQKQGSYKKTLYFDDTLGEWRIRECECSNKDKSLDFSIVVENNTLKSLETTKYYGIDNGGIVIFSEVYCEVNEIGGNGGGGDITLPLNYEDDNQITNKPAIPHQAIGHYISAEPISPGTLGIDWFKFIHTTERQEYALWFCQTNAKENKVKVLTSYDLNRDYNANCVKLTANIDSSVEIINSGDVNPNLQYSTDGLTWINYESTINLVRGQSMLFRGNNHEGLSNSTNNFVRFNITGDVSVSGNVMGLLDNGTGTITEIPNDYCFYGLFRNSYGITNVSKNFLPADELRNGCYQALFFGCNKLKEAPELPTMHLAENCYRGMFYGCESLKVAPDLNAFIVPAYAYMNMFSGCLLLESAYVAGEILSLSSYDRMFYGCSSLFKLKIEYMKEFDNTVFNFWLAGTPSYGFIYYNGDDTTTSASAIPVGWQKIEF